MELVFQEKQVECLNRILCETVLLEQTADIIVPDSLPDIERVVDAFGMLMIRTEECIALSASAAGVVQAGVLYVSEDGSVQQIPAQIPFSVRRDFSSQQESCTLQCRCVLRSVDARALNSRKLLVRVGIACTLTVYAQERVTLYDLPDPAPNLQLKRTQLPLTMPLGLCEKSFVLNEELELASGKPALERLLKCLCRVQLAEQKLVGDKAVFKGGLLIHALYEDTEGKLSTHEWNVPFSQYAQMEQELDENELLTELSMMSFEVEPDSQTDCRRLLLSANLLAQCTAIGQKKITLIEDAYCTDAQFTPQFDACEMTGILDRQVFRETAAAVNDEPAGSVVDVWMYPEEVSRQRTDGAMLLEQSLNCNVLYYDTEGKLQGSVLRPTLRVETAISDAGNCAVTELNAGEVLCSAGAAGLEVRVPISMTVESSSLHRLNTVKGGQITELPEQTGRRPSVILRRTEREEELWELGKAYRTPIQTIKEANDLQTDVIPADAMLLIPL